MDGIAIRPATRADAARLNAALRALSGDLGDTHRATDADVARAGFGPDPAFHALLAEAGGQVVGAALYSPLFSTTTGAAGAYVSDLWVAQAARGTGLGRRLLAEVRRAARTRWGAEFLRLAVHDHNGAALAFYCRLGFTPATGGQWLTLSGDGFEALGDPE